MAMNLSASELLKLAITAERKLRREKHDAVPTLPINVQSDTGLVCIKNRRGASWNALRDQAHTIQCTSFLEAAKTLQTWADQLLHASHQSPETALALVDNVTPQQIQEMIAAGVQLAFSRGPSLALTNGGVGDTVNQALSQISQKIDESGVVDRAAEFMIQDDEDRVLERAVEMIMEKKTNWDPCWEDIRERALAKAVEDLDEEDVRKSAIEKDIEDNEEDVRVSAIDKYIKDNAEEVAAAVTHDQAVDRYILNNAATVRRDARTKYLSENDVWTVLSIPRTESFESTPKRIRHVHLRV